MKSDYNDYGDYRIVRSKKPGLNEVQYLGGRGWRFVGYLIDEEVEKQIPTARAGGVANSGLPRDARRCSGMTDPVILAWGIIVLGVLLLIVGRPR